jgi:hypothetical protein
MDILERQTDSIRGAPNGAITGVGNDNTLTESCHECAAPLPEGRWMLNTKDIN